MHSRSLRKIGVILIGLTAWIIAACTAHAQSYPTKPVRFLIGLSPGSSSDTIARILANGLTRQWNQTVIVENRTGAGGNIAADAVAKADRDGYTLLFWNVGIAISHSYYRNLPYNALSDLAPVSQPTNMPMALCVSPSLPVHSVSELIDYAKARPGKVFFSSAGLGQADHMAGELFAHMTSIDVVHVPYRGGPQALTALMTGEVSFDFPGLPVGLTFANSGKVRCIAVTTAKRSPAAPELPTIAESGVPAYSQSIWTGVFAPAGTSKALIEKVSEGLASVLKVPAVQKQLAKQGAEPVGSTPTEFETFFRGEVRRFAELMGATGIRAK